MLESCRNYSLFSYRGNAGNSKKLAQDSLRHAWMNHWRMASCQTVTGVTDWRFMWFPAISILSQYRWQTSKRSYAILHPVELSRGFYLAAGTNHSGVLRLAMGLSLMPQGVL
jgi:hypothetical protein